MELAGARDCGSAQEKTVPWLRRSVSLYRATTTKKPHTQGPTDITGRPRLTRRIFRIKASDEFLLVQE
ncbi:hypothetical protein AMELA_G00217310 [Ameiurus melas]|uniref:Uncharacterized protein n=1 Tax=Ameiurus melas TaxID=219545 RepID=A0A7J6A1L9_AMEME|nr:hypothetical protein AMELA_G00217310 [Ameiurus melas]